VADFETLIWEVEDRVATITLNRPEKLNAMSWVMFNEIADAFDRAAGDDEVRAVVITGAGGAFCSGADLTDPANAVSNAFEFKDRMANVHRIAR
jgi:enoyl-CoA hydratase/carnithine racemase